MPREAHLLTFLPSPVDEAVLAAKQRQAMVSDVLFWYATTETGRCSVCCEHSLISDPTDADKDYFSWLRTFLDHFKII